MVAYMANTLIFILRYRGCQLFALAPISLGVKGSAVSAVLHFSASVLLFRILHPASGFLASIQEASF